VPLSERWRRRVLQLRIYRQLLKGAAITHLRLRQARVYCARHPIDPPPQIRPSRSAVATHAPAHDAPRSAVSGMAPAPISRTLRIFS